jgi:outer membrane protein assembly factor BamB
VKRTVFALFAVLVIFATAALARRHAAPATALADDPVAQASVVAWIADPGAVRSVPATDTVDVLTAHNGAARLGWNDRERVLTTANVGSPAFRKLLELPLDGQAYAQPLIVTGVDLPGLGRHTLLIAATENDSVYAFDADTGERLWRHTFAGCCGVRPAPAQLLNDQPCDSVKPVVGISSTPVVDRRTGTLYVVAKTMTNGEDAPTFHNTLHALALGTGADRIPPREIAANADISLHGVFARGHSFKHSLKRLLPGGGSAAFDARAQYNRPGLLLANGMVYVGFGSHCDIPQSHGWVFAYRAADLTRLAAFATTRDWNDENLGSVWQSGFGLTSDAAGNVYFTTGNGPFNAAEGGRNFGNTLLKVTPNLGRVLDYFTPYTQQELAENDGDFGGGAMIALPDGGGDYPRLGVASSKIRALFLLDRDHLGRYTKDGPDRVLQRIGDDHDTTHWCIGTCGGPAYYAGPRGEYLFNVWALDALRAYRLDRGGRRPSLVEVAHSPNVFPGSGGSIPSVSSNGKLPGTGVVWSLTRPNITDVYTKPIELFAYDASDVSHLLYRGGVSLWPNKVGHPFLTPTIANGRVYVGGYRSISVFGLASAHLAEHDARPQR